MKYKAAGCACVALMCIAPAFAQADEAGSPPDKPISTSSVTLYGLIDQGIEFVNNVAISKKATANSWRMGDGTATSYFGIRGSEDLGGGLA